MCAQACDVNNNDDPPPLSLANGIDFGVMSRLPNHTPLSEMEAMATSDVRLYHLTVKVWLLSWPPPHCEVLPRHTWLGWTSYRRCSPRVSTLPVPLPRMSRAPDCSDGFRRFPRRFPTVPDGFRRFPTVPHHAWLPRMCPRGRPSPASLCMCWAAGSCDGRLGEST